MRRFLISFMLILGSACVAGESVASERVPEGGLRPRAAVDSKGVLHLLWLQGDAAACNVRHARRDGTGFAAARTVNSVPRSAVALGTVRGAQLAVDGQGRAHILWVGTQGSTPRPADGSTPVLYSREQADGTFTEQRNLLGRATGVDGGGAIAAGQDGTVWVFWHAAAGATDDAQRAAFARCSRDGGATFGPESRLLAAATGACACCEMGAGVDAAGGTTTLLRMAGASVYRDQIAVWTASAKAKPVNLTLAAWRTPTCPMSTCQVVTVGTRTWAAWECDGQVAWSEMRDGRALRQINAPGTADGRKHPSIAVDASGRVCLVWTEGTGWQRGGRLAWQVWNEAGTTDGDGGRTEGVPAWSLAAVVAMPTGGFTIFY